MKEYKYIKEWTKKKKKYIKYCVIIFISIFVLMYLIGYFKNSLPEIVVNIGTFADILLFFVLIYLFIKIRICPKCGYYFGRHGYAPKNCPRCGLRLED